MFFTSVASFKKFLTEKSDVDIGNDFGRRMRGRSFPDGELCVDPPFPKSLHSYALLHSARLLDGFLLLAAGGSNTPDEASCYLGMWPAENPTTIHV